MSNLRKCPKCGTVQSAERSVCVDCGSVLHGTVSDAEAASYEKETAEQVEELNSESHTFRVPLWAKIVAGLDAATVVAFFLLINQTDLRADSKYILITPAFGIASMIGLLFPKLDWLLASRRSSWLYEEKDLTPSGAYLSVSRLFCTVMFVIALAVMLFSMLGNAFPPSAPTVQIHTAG